MTKEQLEALGIESKLAEKAAEQSAEELKDYVPKHRFDEVTAENKKMKDAAKEYESSLEELKKSAGDSKELQEQIQALQNEQKETEAKYQEELKNTKITNAIKLSILGKAQDEDLVAGLFDKSKLILGEDGKVTGLEEQLKALKESKKFLFKEEKSESKPGFIKVGANPPDETGNEERHVTLKDAVAGYFQQAQ